MKNFINHWDEAMEDLRDIWQLLNIFLETTLLKERMTNVVYVKILIGLNTLMTYITTGLEMIYPTATIDNLMTNKNSMVKRLSIIPICLLSIFKIFNL